MNTTTYTLDDGRQLTITITTHTVDTGNGPHIDNTTATIAYNLDGEPIDPDDAQQLLTDHAWTCTTQ